MTGISQGFGDVTKIEEPDPNNYGKFIEVDRIRGAVERATTSLVGRYAATVKSTLLKIAKKGCSTDLQLHIGECQNPADFTAFSKVIILEDALITTYNTEDMGALGSDEQAKVDETAEISASDIYEVVPLSFSTKASDIVTNQIIDITIADNQSCGSCGAESDGCYKLYAVTKLAGGSPGTPADVVFSNDKGATFFAHDVDSLTNKEPTGIAGVGNYIVVISNADDAYHYALKSEFTSTTDPSFVKVSTGIVAAGSPNAISSADNKAFIVGDGGYIYLLEAAGDAVSVLDAGNATTSVLGCVHALDENTCLAGGAAGSVVFTLDQSNWTKVTKPSNNTITSVWMKSLTEWIVGDSAGALYYTTDSGTSWTAKSLPGTTPSTISRISFATNSVGFVTAVVASRARAYETFDGGYSWTVLPQGSGTFPAADSMLVAACGYDPNFVFMGGLADDASNGILVVGAG